MAVANPYIGKMDRLVDIKKTVKTQSDTGAQKTEDELVCRSWAALEEGRGVEELEGKVMHGADLAYVMRWNSDVRRNGKDYVLIDRDTRYRIVHVEELGRKRHMRLNVTVYE